MRIGIDLLSMQATGTLGREILACVRPLVSGLVETSADHHLVPYGHEDLPLNPIPSAPLATLTLVRRGETTATRRLEQMAAADPDRPDWLVIPNPFDPRYVDGPPPGP
ncbi:MAG TPA: hypothetical protein VKP69_34195 [Isosphaeraceae bacterium]|nr:hypothetical protein [Isosphaeraceae bacterium]